MAKAYNMWPVLVEKDKALKSLKHLFKIFNFVRVIHNSRSLSQTLFISIFVFTK